jgi:hypothetical protein
MAKKVIFNNKVEGNESNMLVGKVGEHVFALTKSVKEMNDAIRWCNNHKAGDVFECEKYRMELVNE